MTWSELRQRYAVFCYEKYDIQILQDEVICSFDFSIEGLSAFRPTWRIPVCCKLSADHPMLHKLVFSLGMAEAVSYWKIACPKTMMIRAGFVSPAQISWWKKLYFHGLGEFFHVNQIDTSFDQFVTITCASSCETAPPASPQPPLQGALIPIGGGKDSAVTVQLLQGTHHQNNCFFIGERPSCRKTAQMAGFEESQIICASRTLDPRMLSLNAQGFLNGHTPFSSIVAFSAILTAYLTEKKYVVLSNEASANEATVQNTDVNHQYSKSYVFEQDISDYLARFVPCGVQYFSLLRPLSEWQIAALFAQFPAYHSIFRSCNRGAKKDIWCCHCAKCLFVAIILSPFLNADAMRRIFPKNLLEDSDLSPELEQLTGIQHDKPFECVGSRDEVNAAICNAIDRMQAQGEPIPYLYRQYMQSEQYRQYQHRPNPYSTYYNTAHMVPPCFEQRLKERWKQCQNR